MILPQHIAFIVDGNRRWAKLHHKPQIRGHQKAVDEIMDSLIYRAIDLKIPYLTFWVWSTENWKRGRLFANLLFGILEKRLNTRANKYIQDGVKLMTIGDLTKLPKSIVGKLEDVKSRSQNNKKITVTIAINYGGRDEIVRAMNKLIKDRLKHLRGGPPHGEDSSEVKLTEKEFNNYLDTTGIPDPDLIIRTGGSQRLSGFLLWQSEYSELYFTNTFFPDFTNKELDKALKDYSNRKRNFGR
jgi:undecaprenyl diphosphate synthase